MPNSETNTGLIVPIDIIGLCVGINDVNHPDGTGTFAGATTTFSNQTGDNDAFLGSNVIRPLSETPLNVLTAGIHVHWALPEALTRGNYDKKTTRLQFAHVPNRWLLSRVAINGTSFTRKSWIIESDTLERPDSSKKQFITLPVDPVKASGADYMFVGKPAAFTPSWTDPGDKQFNDLTHHDLSAVSSGEVSFAAFYPNSGNVFGFYDDMSDVAAGTTVNVMYQLTGWFSDAAKDPLSGGKSLSQLQEDYSWTFNGGNTGDTIPTYTLYSGLVQTLEWNVNRDYIINQPDRNIINATITVGNNPAEAFSAYFKELLQKDNSFFEKLMNAFQAGLLNEFKEPKPDQLAQMEEIIYQKQFAGLNAGIIYSVIKKPDETNNTPEQPVNTLPLELAEALNLLNVAQQKMDFYTDFMKRIQWQMFSDWYRLMNAETNEKKNSLSRQIQQRYAEWLNSQKTFKSLDDSFKEQKARVVAQVSALGPLFAMQQDPARATGSQTIS